MNAPDPGRLVEDIRAHPELMESQAVQKAVARLPDRLYEEAWRIAFEAQKQCGQIHAICLSPRERD